jgi:4-amino-4-deoxy-L-arabinose transferase-like glycosyltransferase
VPFGRPEMWMPLLLFGLFTLLSVVGAYVVAARFRGRKAGVLAALLTALFFGALLFGVLALIREGGAL